MPSIPSIKINFANSGAKTTPKQISEFHEHPGICLISLLNVQIFSPTLSLVFLYAHGIIEEKGYTSV